MVWGGDGSTTQSRNVYMPTNEFSLKTLILWFFQAITFLAIADYADTLPVTFESLNGATEKEVICQTLLM